MVWPGAPGANLKVVDLSKYCSLYLLLLLVRVAVPALERVLPVVLSRMSSPARLKIFKWKKSPLLGTASSFLV